MILIKSNKEIEKLRKAGEITAGALEAAREALRPGMTTHELDKVVERYFLSHGAKPGFKGYGGFPASACISVKRRTFRRCSTILLTDRARAIIWRTALKE